MSDGSIIGVVGEGAGKLFARNFLAASKYAKQGESQKALLAAAKDANRIPDIILDGKEAGKDVKNAWQNIKNIDAKTATSNTAASDIFQKAKNFDKAKHIGLLNMADDKVVEWGLFNNTFLEKRLTNSKNMKWLLDLDTNMLNTKWGTKLVEKTGGKIITKEVVKEGTKQTVKTVSGKLGSRLIANTLAKVCHLNLIFSSLLEIPEIKKGFDNDDGANQIGRSGINIALSWVFIGLGSTIGRALPTKYKGIASLLGAAVGSGAGMKVGNHIGTGIFGEKSWDSKSGKTTYKSGVTYA